MRVPSVDEEDRKRLLRERRRLVKERTALTDAILGLLKLHGVFGLHPRARRVQGAFAARLAEVQTACGAPLPPRARREIERLAERLALVEGQIAAVEAERNAVVRRGDSFYEAGLPPDVCPDGEARAAAQLAALTRLKGIGSNDAALLAHEVFYRDFRNRREVAGWAGIAPTPWASGDIQRDQGIGRDGPAWIRAQLIQMAWRWLRFQPDSALSRWFERRTAGAHGRMRRVMIVALARKPLIALWRFQQTGLIPTGARLA